MPTHSPRPWVSIVPKRLRSRPKVREPLLQVKNLSIGFASRSGLVLPILRNIDLAFSEGETIGLVGESGCGKSTLALAMMGYLKSGLRVLDGESVFRGRNVFDMDDRTLEKIRGGELALIPQNAGQSLTPTSRVGQQIDESVKLHTRLAREQRRERTVELLSKVRLPEPEELSKRYPHELSGGQQQRVAIAMALAGEPGRSAARRADDRSRCHHSSPYPRAVARLGNGDRNRDGLRQPRPGGDCAGERPCGRHVCGRTCARGSSAPSVETTRAPLRPWPASVDSQGERSGGSRFDAGTASAPWRCWPEMRLCRSLSHGRAAVSRREASPPTYRSPRNGSLPFSRTGRATPSTGTAETGKPGMAGQSRPHPSTRQRGNHLRQAECVRPGPGPATRCNSDR